MTTPRPVSDRLATLLMRGRALPLAITAAIIAGCLLVLPLMKQDVSFDVFFTENHPDKKLLDVVEQQFGSDDVVMVVLEGESLFTHENLTVVKELSAQLRTLEYERADGTRAPMLTDVESLATVNDAYGSDMTYQSKPLVPDPIPTDAAALEAIYERAKKNPILAENLINEAGTATVAWLRQDLLLSEQDKVDFHNQLTLIARELEQQHPRLKVHLTGVPSFQADLANTITRDTVVAIPSFILIILVLSIVYLRRLRSTVVVFVGLVLTLIGGLAMIPATGSLFNPMSTAIPRILILLAATAFFHYFSELGERSALHPEDKGVARSTLADLLGPVALASITTAIGFAAFMISDIPAVRYLGIPVAFGSLLAFVLVALLIAFAWSYGTPSSWCSPRGLPASGWLPNLLARWAEVVIKHKVASFGLGVLVVAVSAIGIARVHLNHDYLNLFAETSSTRVAIDRLEANAGGFDTLLISIKLEEDGAFLEPARLKKLEDLEGFLRAEVGADRVISMAQWVKIMHRAFFGEDQAHYVLPETREAVAQLVLLNSDDRFEDYVDERRSWARVVVRGRYHDTNSLEKAFDSIDAYLEREFPAAEGYNAYSTGDMRMLVHVQEAVAKALPLTLALSILLIMLVTGLFLRSAGVALQSIVPNSLPVLAVFGAIGFANEPLNVSMALIPPIIFGIAVDDTIHFLTQYRRSLAAGKSPEDAIRATFRIKGPAIVWTTLVLCIGFSAFLGAEFVSDQKFGLFGALGIFMALVGDLFFLPASLLLFARSKR